MSFIQDPRLRQRWNQISHNAEAATENAAAGIWTLQQQYINPCLTGLGNAVDSCGAVCFGYREERAWRERERERGAHRARAAENMFDFYDDWDEMDAEGPGGSGSSGGGIGVLGAWGVGRTEDWDRLLAGTGAGRGKTGTVDVMDQPRRKRGMNYGTRGAGRRRQSAHEDPTIIPSTAPLGFLRRLPFKFRGTLRYKPSAANLQDHPGGTQQGNDAENAPLLGGSDDEHNTLLGHSPLLRARSNTVSSRETSSSYRSREDLFPSDGEGNEDAVPLDDEFAMALELMDDLSGNKSRNSKGKRPEEEGGVLRSESRATLKSVPPVSSRNVAPPSLDDLQRERAEAQKWEESKLEHKRREAKRLAFETGLSRDEGFEVPETAEKKHSIPIDDKVLNLSNTNLQLEDRHKAQASNATGEMKETKDSPTITLSMGPEHDEADFIPARLPQFG